MSNFSDPTHSVSELVFQGAHEEAIDTLCNNEVLEALAHWQQRKRLSDPQVTALQLDRTRSFTISYNGETDNYWPDEKSNAIGETLIREFLFRDGVCQLRKLMPRLYVANFTVLAIIDTEYLMVCPYPTESGNISGLLVVCVNQHLRQKNA